MLTPDPLDSPCEGGIIWRIRTYSHGGILNRARELYRRVCYFIRGWLRG
jgi:hypothetical protein